MCCLVKPFGEAGLRAAVEMALLRFAHNAAVCAEAASPEQALEDRRAVGRAKAALMRAHGLDEARAFGRLRGRVM